MNRSQARWSALILSVGALTLGVVAPSSHAHAAGSARGFRGSSPWASTAGTTADGAQARSGIPGWRVYKTIATRDRYVILGGIDAVSASDAWLAGAVSDAEYSTLRPLVEHWNGARWHPVTLPSTVAAKLAGTGSFGPIGASSSRNVWLMGPTGKYAHLRGTRWTVGRLPGTEKGQLALDSVKVFGPGDAWVFGVRYSGGTHPKFTPYAARFNGTAWHLVAIPGHGPIAVSALSADDMWAVIDPLPIGTSAGPSVLHWNGTTWRAEDTQPTLPGHATLFTIMAESDDDVWVGGDAPNGRGGTSELALHWDGTSWTTASPPSAPTSTDYYLTSLVADGGGGFWGVGEALPGTPRFWHYSAGAWSAPVKTHPGWIVFPLDQVPGTRSIWAIAASASLAKGLILLHGPVPR